MKIALAGNPNCGKTTMFNALTGANQYVGNWPGVTVEYKEGKTKTNKDIIVTDLPGIYSLSPYTSEEIVSRDYLRRDDATAIINIVDATNIERNLYLTTQLIELGKPVVIALNMVDALKKSGDKIDSAKLSEKLGCKVVETIALHNKGIKEVTEAAAEAATKGTTVPAACFANDVEEAITSISAILPATVKENLKRWTAIKVLEKDEKVIADIQLSDADKAKALEITKALESAKDDDIESIITNERYNYIINLLKGVITKSGKKMTTSDKIDRVVTNRILGIPIFLCVMGFIYWIAVSTVGAFMTDWTNDSLVGEIIQGNVQSWLESMGTNAILTDCIVNGIIGGLGAVLGFVPQMFILFLLLSIVEDCGYMVRIAFVMDRLFRKFGLSGKSFIPLLIGSGCGVPGIMASRTIENENDRRMTIMTTTWIPCGAKLPVIACMAAVLAGMMSGTDCSWVGPLMYAIGIASVVIAAVILKKTKYFHGPAAPFIMELPQYHIPQPKTVLMHTWERTWSFIKKAGTILFLACIVMWFLSSYGWNKTEAQVAEDGTVVEQESTSFGLVEDANDSVMAKVGGAIRYLFVPLGFGNETGGWQCAAATISGFSAKEGIVSTMGVLAGVGGEDEAAEEETTATAEATEKSASVNIENTTATNEAAEKSTDVTATENAAANTENANAVAETTEKASEETANAEESTEEEEDEDAENVEVGNGIVKSGWFPSALAAFAFLLFNLLDSPCLAAISTMANELKSRKWFWFAIGFQNIFAYIVTMMVYQIGSLIAGHSFGAGYSPVALVLSFVFLAAMLFGLFRKNPYKNR